ncbi:DUF1659 domain-containing protein [Bacillota bacterium LX-D]|nr:DUF1659 domain-containing protein [Bacillota bacterium LX-D]
MAVVATPVQSVLRIVVENGVDGKGNTILKNITFSKVKTAATDQDVFDTAQALAGLQQRMVQSIHRIGTNDLAES